MITHLFVHVEEPSMQAALDSILPRVLAGRAITLKIVDHGSKQSLLAKLPGRLRAYRNWPGSEFRVLALVDRDADDCRALKQRLEACARAAGLATKTAPDGSGRFRVVNRIVVEELEAWFLGDPAALAAAYPGVSPTIGNQMRYRNPDAVPGGTWEALLRILHKAGHYRGAKHLPKIEVARRVSAHMRLDTNRSHSFGTFVTGLQALLA